jgi:hypothetical protein
MKKKSIKLLVALSMLQGLAGKAYAHEMVVVNDSHGGTSTFCLSTHPVISIDTYSLILKTDDATVMYPLNEFVTFSIVDNTTTGIRENNVVSPSFSFGSGLKACGLQPLSPVRIYTLSGIIVAEGYTDSEGRLQLDVKTERNKTYLVKTTTGSFKFIINR